MIRALSNHWWSGYALARPPFRSLYVNRPHLIHMDSARKPRILECVYFGIVTNDYFGASEFIGRTDQAGGSRPQVEVLVRELDTVLVGPSVQEALQSMNQLIGRFKRKRQESPPMSCEVFLQRKQAFLEMVPGLSLTSETNGR